jgi:hypothetical protein
MGGILMRSLLALGVAFVVIGTSAADEVKVPLDKLPRAVKKAYEKHFPGAEFKNASTEKEDGKIVYEVTFTFKKSNIDATFDGEGTLLGTEKEIATSNLPKAITEALEAKFPKATLKKAEEIAKGDGKLAAYEVVVVTSANETIEVKLDPAGKITAEEKKGKAEKKEG